MLTNPIICGVIFCRRPKIAVAIFYHPIPEPDISVSRVLFLIREISLHRFFTSGVYLFTLFHQPQPVGLLFRLFPDVPGYRFLHLAVLRILLPLTTSWHTASICHSSRPIKGGVVHIARRHMNIHDGEIG